MNPDSGSEGDAAVERDALLADLLGGVRRVDDPVVQRAFARDPSLRDEFNALRVLAGELDAVASVVQRDVAQARAQVSARDRRQAEDSLRAGLGMPPRRRVVWPYVLAAAAALVAATLVFWPSGRDVAPLPQNLAADKVAILAPKWHRELAQGFVWNLPPAPGCTYQVKVFGSAAQPVLLSEDLEGTTWRPTDTQLADLLALPTLRWELWQTDPDVGANLVDSVEVRR